MYIVYKTASCFLVRIYRQQTKKQLAFYILSFHIFLKKIRIFLVQSLRVWSVKRYNAKYARLTKDKLSIDVNKNSTLFFICILTSFIVQYCVKIIKINKIVLQSDAIWWKKFHVDMSSWTVLTWNLWMKTAFYTKFI